MTVALAPAVAAAVLAMAVPALATRAPSTHRHPAVSGSESIVIATTDPSHKAKSAVIASGAFTEGGRDTVQSKNVDLLKFADGSFLVTHHGTAHYSFNRKTCYATGLLTGTYSLSHGTGSFAGVTGHGKYRGQVFEVGVRRSNGRCGTPSGFSSVVKAHGPISY
jgi:hypothetical protein